MSVAEAESRLALEKAEEAWIKAKASGKKDAAYRKAEEALIAARDDYRTNHRQPTEGSAQPAPVDVKIEVN